MKIYHGSIEKVEKPEIRILRNRTLDYGYGFYIVLPYSSEHRKIKDIKTFNEIWNKTFWYI